MLVQSRAHRRSPRTRMTTAATACCCALLQLEAPISMDRRIQTLSLTMLARMTVVLHDAGRLAPFAKLFAA